MATTRQSPTHSEPDHSEIENISSQGRAHVPQLEAICKTTAPQSPDLGNADTDDDTLAGVEHEGERSGRGQSESQSQEKDPNEGIITRRVDTDSPLPKIAGEPPPKLKVSLGKCVYDTLKNIGRYLFCLPPRSADNPDPCPGPGGALNPNVSADEGDYGGIFVGEDQRAKGHSQSDDPSADSSIQSNGNAIEGAQQPGLSNADAMGERMIQDGVKSFALRPNEERPRPLNTVSGNQVVKGENVHPDQTKKGPGARDIRVENVHPKMTDREGGNKESDHPGPGEMGESKVPDKEGE